MEEDKPVEAQTILATPPPSVEPIQPVQVTPTKHFPTLKIIIAVVIVIILIGISVALYFLFHPKAHKTQQTKVMDYERNTKVYSDIKDGLKKAFNK